MPLFTIGYEGQALDDVLGKLKANKIELVVDVRALPLSRKRGFSKNALRHRRSTASASPMPIALPRHAEADTRPL